MHHPDDESKISQNRAAYFIVNALTFSRAVASMGAVMFSNDVPTSLAFVGYAAATDLIDGPASRVANVDTNKGAIHDNLADLCMRKSWEALILINSLRYLGEIGLDNTFTQLIAVGILAYFTITHTIPWVKDTLNRSEYEERYASWLHSYKKQAN